jgi:hypothetical protein
MNWRRGVPLPQIVKSPPSCFALYTLCIRPGNTCPLSMEKLSCGPKMLVGTTEVHLQPCWSA